MRCMLFSKEGREKKEPAANERCTIGGKRIEHVVAFHGVKDVDGLRGIFEQTLAASGVNAVGVRSDLD